MIDILIRFSHKTQIQSFLEEDEIEITQEIWGMLALRCF